MTTYFSYEILLTGIAIFLARIVDVSLGTFRTISIVKGRMWTAFFIGIIEISIWLVVMSTVILKIKEVPVLGVFFVFGFAFGNVVGIMVEKRLLIGDIVLRVISRKQPLLMTQALRQAGFRVTTFQGEGRNGPVVELYMICRRRERKIIISLVHKFEPDAFYISEQAGHASKSYDPTVRSTMLSFGGWRNILKKK
ncbi:MAG: DUF2179 domain-containing protein [Proteobacteria bacterium]|nr:DUF2179 domain-containing protein [Pseudomonadota bacterium]MBU1233903.1 DUF2179 domain-containing protein [Pseudomonadota bacterium]MBU1417495.1 DUF2179 domain-containing protein [Pseudomonadota bacterium]